MIKPLSNRVLVQPNPTEDRTESGIIIPDTAKEKPLKGKILAMGSGKVGKKMTVKVGDSVMYGKHAGMELNVEGVDCIMMREDDIIGIL